MIRKAQEGETDQDIIDNLLDEAIHENENNQGDVHNHNHDNSGKTLSEIDLDKIQRNNLNFVIQSDASQDIATILAQTSECSVIRGPSGTRISQLIVILISDSIAKQKKVMRVCQKRVYYILIFKNLLSRGCDFLFYRLI